MMAAVLGASAWLSGCVATSGAPSCVDAFGREVVDGEYGDFDVPDGTREAVVSGGVATCEDDRGAPRWCRCFAAPDVDLEAGHERPPLPVDPPSTTAACPGSRAQIEGAVAYGEWRWAAWQWADAGQRVLVNLAGAVEDGGADLFLVASDMSWVAASRERGTSRETIDFRAPRSGWYVAGASGVRDGAADYVRLTSDVTDPTRCGAVGTPVDYCFGAVGSNCDGVLAAAPCTRRDDARIECQVSVGSQMHDTCCSHNPAGEWCNGEDAGRGWPSDCGAEWAHAQNDATTTRQFAHVFDPTEPRYRPAAMAAWDSFASADDRMRARPNEDSILAPSSAAIWDTDAELGWCASGQFEVRSSVQGSYASCL